MLSTTAVPCVWVVDDDESVRFAVGMLMESMGWRSVVLPSAERFLSEFQPETGACLVLDLQMPGMAGVDLLEVLQRQQPALPVIVITAFPENGLARRSLAAGARAILSKPFAADELIAEIRKALG